MLNYSFVIPHHNSPDLLTRCLNSIPQREDIEIIVADDNSDEDKKPQVKRLDVKIVYVDAAHTKGAGRARNYALREAKGRWIVFADCDDFFVPDFIDVLDKYKDDDLEVVYHDAKAANTHTLEPMSRLLQRHNEYFNRYDGSKNTEDFIRYRIHSPWWKMVRRDFIEQNKIVFEEVPKGNDIFFTYQVGFFAQKIAVEKQKLYIYTYNPRGITNGKKNSIIHLNRLRNWFKCNEFYKFIGHPEWVSNNGKLWIRILRHDGLKVFCQTLIGYLKNHSDIYSARMDYVESIRARIKKI